MKDFSQAKRIHIVGIKGAGTSALARILVRKGVVICGSDTSEYFFTDSLLTKIGVRVEQFDPSHINPSLDAVIYSTGYAKEHPEISAAIERGIPLFSYPEAVAQLFRDGYGIAICGSHGKTTITALTAWVANALGLDPTALIGSTIQGTGINAYAGHSPYWILEADEYQNKFEYYHPKAVVISNIEYDHPDFFQNEKEYIDTFTRFIKKASCELIIACIDDRNVQAIKGEVPDKRFITYGQSDASDYRIANIREDRSGFQFEVIHQGDSLGTFHTSLVGVHNVANACAVIALANSLAFSSIEKIRDAIASFPGTGRRFEILGSIGKTLVADDYAHHPTEIAATLQGVRTRFPDKKIVCCFMPHTFTRTKAFFDMFASSFAQCDSALILDIYPSARELKGTVHSSELTNAIQAHSANATYTGSIEHTIAFLQERIHDIDILITMGAGDVWRVGVKLLEKK